MTARSLFDGETVSDSIGAILHRDPDWNLLPPQTPGQARRLLRRCLERDRALRLHDIADARVELLDAQRSPDTSDTGSQLRRHRVRGGSVGCSPRQAC